MTHTGLPWTSTKFLDYNLVFLIIRIRSETDKENIYKSSAQVSNGVIAWEITSLPAEYLCLASPAPAVVVTLSDKTLGAEQIRYSTD